MTNGNGSQPKDLEKIAELIRKCLALSSSSNEAEAALAASKVQELLEKYNLDLEDVKDREPAELVEGEIPYSYRWIPELYWMCARHNFCRAVNHSYRDAISVLGRKANVFATVELAEWLRPQLTSFCRKAYHESSYTISESKFRNSFMAGAINVIDSRLRELFKDRETINPKLTSLVVSTKQENETFVHSRYPFLATARTSRSEFGAYSAGQSAGNNIGIIQPSHHVDGGNLRLT